MLSGLYIFVDDDFDAPVYADPDADDLDETLWTAVCEAVNDALEGDHEADGHRKVGDQHVVWRVFLKMGLSFVAVTRDLKTSTVARYLKSVSRAYLDEVDDARRPEREGVADVVVDVIPPWEDDED